MEADIHDIQDLAQCDEEIKTYTGLLNECIDHELKLEISLIAELRHIPDIAQSLSLKAKFIQLRCKTKNPIVMEFVDDWLRACANTRKKELQIRQLEGRRDSIKKKLSVLHERGI